MGTYPYHSVGQSDNFTPIGTYKRRTLRLFDGFQSFENNNLCPSSGGTLLISEENKSEENAAFGRATSSMDNSGKECYDCQLYPKGISYINRKAGSNASIEFSIWLDRQGAMNKAILNVTIPGGGTNLSVNHLPKWQKTLMSI